MMEQLSFMPNGNIAPCPYRQQCLNHPAGCEGKSHWCKRIPTKDDKKFLRIPCERFCDVEWCSMVCFKRRGYIWDANAHSWVYGPDGIALRLKNRECDWLTDKEREHEKEKSEN